MPYSRFSGLKPGTGGLFFGVAPIPENCGGIPLGIVKRIAGILIAASVAAGCWAQGADFTMTVLHTNDMHSHAEPSVVKGKSIGGYARQASVIIDRRSKVVNPVLLNAGDTFQGTLYFNEYEGLADLSYMNMIGYQAACLGNHEFDRGIPALVTFASLARFPIVSTNLDVSGLPDLAKVVKKSTILEVGGQRIGLVGAVPDDLLNLVLPVPGLKVLDYTKSIQAEVDNLTKQGVDKIILLSHGGLEQDIATAPKFKNIDVIIGGHSHTLLGKVDIPGFDGSRGDYPIAAKDASGNPLLIVQAWEWGKVVGELEVTFNDKGVLKSWKGAPILVDESWPENPFVKALYAAFAKPVQALMTKEIAQLDVDLNRNFGQMSEPSMGYVIADAAVEKTKGLGAQFGFWNVGGVRSQLSKGKVTYGQLAEVCPFGNQLVVLDLKGSELLAALQQGVGTGGQLLPSNGFVYTVQGGKVVSATFNGQAIDPNKSYKVTFSNFTSGGGDGHTVLKEAKGQRIDTGFVDLEALIAYFQAHSPLKDPGSRIRQ